MVGQNGSEAERRMLTTPHKRFAWAREDRFTDFSEFSFFHMLLKRRRPSARVGGKELARERPGKKRWKPAPWTPWLWIK
jgi:hypothetical protein